MEFGSKQTLQIADLLFAHNAIIDMKDMYRIPDIQEVKALLASGDFDVNTVNQVKTTQRDTVVEAFF